MPSPLGDITGVHILEGFLAGLATASAAAVVAGVVALLRFIKRTDAHRVAQLEHSYELGRKLEHRQGHVLRWCRAAGRKIGLPFPLEDDIDLDVDDDWDEGKR